MDFLSLLSPAHSLLLYSVNIGGLLISNLKYFVAFRHPIILYMATQSAYLGLQFLRPSIFMPMEMSGHVMIDMNSRGPTAFL